MPLIHLVLADNDFEYVNRLAQWFIENKQNQFQISAFSEKESFKKFISENKGKINIILASEDFLTDVPVQDTITAVLGQAVKFENLNSIEKYQPAPLICSDVLSILSNRKPETEKWYPLGKSELVVCYSMNIYLKSKIALLLSLLSKDYVYISLDSFPFYKIEGNNDTYKNLSDVLYHIKSRKGNPVMALESAVLYGNNQIFYIPPIDNPRDLWDLTDAETDIFIEALKSWGRFSRIIIDHECNTGPMTIKLFEAASSIIIPFETANLHQLSRIKSMTDGIHGLSSNKIKWVFCDGNGEAFLPHEFGNCHELRWINGSMPFLNGFILDSYKRSQLEGLLSE